MNCSGLPAAPNSQFNHVTQMLTAPVLSQVLINPFGTVKKIPKLSSFSIVIGTFPLTGVYSRKAVIANFLRLSVKAFYERDKP